MSTWKKVITDGAALTDIGTPASGDKVLIQDITDSDVIKYVAFSALGGSSTNTNLAIADLTANGNRTLDMDGNSLVFDLNGGGDFTVEDTGTGFQHISIGQDLLELGDSNSRVVVQGAFLAEKGVEQDEASLTAAGAFGAGADITFLGSSNTAVSAGRIYYYSGTTWLNYTSATEAPQKALLGIAAGSSMTKGFILKGFIRPNAVASSTAGALVFGAANASITSTAPTSGYQRIMGHAISTSVIYFNPSAEYLDLA